jgi:hypothetical protein
MRRTRVLVLLATALIAGVPALLPAQDAAALGRRADSLARAAEVARARLQAFDDSVRAAAVATLPVAAGVLRLDAEPAVLSIARDAAPAALDSLRHVLGRALDRIAGHRFQVRERVPARWERPGGPRELLVSVIRPDGDEWRGWRALAEPAALRDVVVAIALKVVFHAADPVFFRWMGDFVPRDSLSSVEWIGLRMALVSAGSAVGPRCHRGDLAACRLVLGLVPVVDPVLQWHDAVTRRRIVRQRSGEARRLSGPMTRDCERGTDSACVVLIRQFAEPLGDPGGPAARFSLARTAVALGGDGALTRLLASSGTPEAHLVAAAGLPMDSIVAHWHARVRDTRIPSRDLTAEIVLVATAWVTGLGLLSLRSSRWR